jgi:hypothetical protein
MSAFKTSKKSVNKHKTIKLKPAKQNHDTEEERYSKFYQDIFDNSNIIENDIFTFIENKNFAIKPNKNELQIYSDFLYIKENFSDNNSSPLYKFINSGFIVEDNSDLPEYKKYKFYRSLRDLRKFNKKGKEIGVSLNENDCLKFAESISMAYQNNNNPKDLFDQMIKADESPSALKMTNNVLFGDESYDKNIDNLKIISVKNDNAIPIQGELYTIVNKIIKETDLGNMIIDYFDEDDFKQRGLTKELDISNGVLDSMKTVMTDKIIEKSNAPYHVAFVIYTHNGVNITLEAEADNESDYLPKFCFYDTNPSGLTFHKRWSGKLDYIISKSEQGFRLDNHGNKDRYETLYNNAETIVLYSRPLDEFKYEFEKEQQSNNKKTSVKSATIKKSSIKPKSRIPSSAIKSTRKSLKPKYSPKNNSKKRLSKINEY